MSTLFPVVCKESPCPICGKTDWCAIGTRAVLCQRVPSEHPEPKTGGWYHFKDTIRLSVPLRPIKRASSEAINAAGLLIPALTATTDAQRTALAGRLGVAVAALVSLQAAWMPDRKAWGFPMRNGQNEIIGIRLRNLLGQKWAVAGSRSGLFVPQYIAPDKISGQIVYVCEGPTDTAAALTLGLFTIGKPSCSAGDEFVSETIKRLGLRQAVIVGDNDAEREVNGQRIDPGLTGALKLQKHLRQKSIKSAIWTPGAKDIREFLQGGGTRALIESQPLIWK